MTYITVPDDILPEKPAPTQKMTKTEYVGNTVDSRLQSVNTISTYIQGSRRIVDYYSQILGRDDAASTHSDDALHIHKQYRLIRGLPVILSNEMTGSQNSGANRSFELIEQGAVPFEITPREGDIIVADVGDGREMQFTVTSTERTSIYPEAYTDITYRGVRILNEDIRGEIDSRTIETLYYHVDMQRTGLKALLTREQSDIRTKLSNIAHALSQRYLRDFLSTKYGTLILPGQGMVTYDPYVARFVKSITDSRLYPEIHKLNLMSMFGDEVAADGTLWDLLLEGDLTQLPMVASKYGIASVDRYRSRPLMGSIYFSGIQRVITMVDPGYSVNITGRERVTAAVIEKAGTQTRDVKDLIMVSDLSNDKEEHNVQDSGLPFINWIVESPYYVLSESFYEKEIPTTVLERLILDRFTKHTTDMKLLYQLAVASLKFDNIERYYYTPLIIALIKLTDGVI